MPARFGEMLLNRRRQMGLSIQQVANTIKIRPQIIEYFENEDFSSMPPRGYAQGMISSYARFLGLNPRMVVDAYFSALSVYERESGRGAGRYQDAAGQVSPHGTYVDGRYLMLDRALPSSRYAQRPPQAGYVSESTSMHEPVSASNLRGGDYGRGRRLGSGASQRATGPRPSSQGRLQSGRSSDPSMTNSLSAQGRGALTRGYSGGRGSVPPRGASSRGNSGYRTVSGTGGRGGARPGEYPRPRPGSGRSGGMVGRAPYAPARSQGPARQGTPSRQLSAGRGQMRSGASRRNGSRRGAQPQSFLQDQRIVMGGLGLVALLLVIVIVLLVFRGCSAGASTSDKQPSSQAQTTASGSSSTTSGDSGSAQSSDAASTDSSGQDQSASTDQSQNQQEQNAQPVVKVSLPSGKTSWIEVKLDGTIVYSDSVTGPFEQEYTVTKSIEVSVTKPADVTVTKDGEKVRYDTKSSGVGKVTITAPQQSTDASAQDQSADQSGQGSDSSSQQGTAGANANGAQSSGASTSGTQASAASTTQTQATG